MKLQNSFRYLVDYTLVLFGVLFLLASVYSLGLALVKFISFLGGAGSEEL